MKKQELIETLKKGQIEGIESMLPLSQVLNLLEKLEENEDAEVEVTFKDINLEKLIERVQENFESDEPEIDDFEFSISWGKELELDSVTISKSWIRGKAKDAINDYFEELKESLTENV